MRNSLKLLAAMACLSGVIPYANAQEQTPFDWSDVTFAAGIGVNYTGIGGSVGYVRGHEYYSLSVGVMNSSDRYGENVGVGLSYQRSDLLPKWFGLSEQHTIGGYVGSLGTEISATIRNGSVFTRQKDMLGGAVTYNYYLNGFQNRGFHFGAFAGYSFSDIEDKGTVGFQVGYRF
ncbi:MAG: hypothetical protein HLUCCO02_12955 [Idiomarinaceae bacterium HL-53]|nr:MAG: hypothetical protein HLUCCO02_12955 [Idiomarinaceae bacterium HL-53]CUS47513.1 hypothetical protein Ga0003345_0442 [Idiomarinaceae bacterium HL-53]